MFEDYDYEDYFEPGVIDKIVIDAIAKAKEQIKESVKINLEAELTKNKTEKERLDKVRVALNDRTREVSKRERDVESKEKNMLRNFSKEFFKEENANIVKLNYDSVLMGKCQHCDDNRKIEITDKFSRKHKVDCNCKVYSKIWKYRESDKLTFRIRKDWNNLERYTYISFTDDDNYGEIFEAKKDRVFPSLEVFKECYKGNKSPYGEYIINKEVAQQCVDYLNSRKDL